MADPPREQRIEALAETLHQAEAQIVLEMLNTALPRWFALREELKQEYRARAVELLDRYEQEGTD